MLTKTTALPIALAAGLLGAGCGPMLSTQTRLETVPAPDNTGTISKDGLVVEIPKLKEFPPQLTLSVDSCNEETGARLVNDKGNAVKTTAIVAPVGARLYPLKIANQTDHVIRLQGTVIRLFDPAENQIEPMSKEDLTGATIGTLQQRGVCLHEAMKFQTALMTVKLIGANTELLPGTTTTGFLFFMPPKADLVGTWKLSLYEFPVKVDASGAPVAKTRFDFAYLSKKYEDTYEQAFMGERKLVSTKEVP